MCPMMKFDVKLSCCIIFRVSFPRVRNYDYYEHILENFDLTITPFVCIEKLLPRFTVDYLANN